MAYRWQSGLLLLLLLVGFLVPSQVQRIGDLLQRTLGGGISLGSLALAAIVYSTVGVVFWKIWSKREQIEPCDLAIAMGACVGLLCLFVPLLGGTWAMRFQIMAPIPGAALVMILFLYVIQTDAFVWQHKAMVAAVALLAIAAPFTMQGPRINTAAAEELRKFRSMIETPDKTLIVAEHGLEFWVGLLTGSRVIMGNVPEKLDSYERVLLVEAKQHMMGPGPPPNRFPDERFNHRSGMDRRPEPQRPHGNQAHQLNIPDHAEQIHETELFRVYEVPLGRR